MSESARVACGSAVQPLGCQVAVGTPPKDFTKKVRKICNRLARGVVLHVAL